MLSSPECLCSAPQCPKLQSFPARRASLQSQPAMPNAECPCSAHPQIINAVPNLAMSLHPGRDPQMRRACLQCASTRAILTFDTGRGLQILKDYQQLGGDARSKSCLAFLGFVGVRAEGLFRVEGLFDADLRKPNADGSDHVNVISHRSQPGNS